MADRRKELTARRLEINGIVQGVGFRPFVFQLAARFYLTGRISNTAEGVSIRIEGPAESVESFCRAVENHPPPLARITRTIITEEKVQDWQDFQILSSEGHNLRKNTLISPDVSVCDDCLTEMRDPDDRRYRYPFINCTNCGPRYTIIENIPYDRPFTSMKRFQMCPDCQKEYDDPLDRRFHAQPNACPRCGPQVTLYNREGELVDAEDPIRMTATLLRQGKIIAIKGLGGFHLSADAENEQAVASLRKRKQREEKPFALMVSNLAKIRKIAKVTPSEAALLRSPARPIVLLSRIQSRRIAPSVAPGNRYLGIMLPYTPLHDLLLAEGFQALVMTSGNRREEPICVDNRDALEQLHHLADYFLMHDRDIYLRSDDSILRVTDGKPRQIRRSRGFVPVPVFLKSRSPEVLACGADLKNTICLLRKDQAFLSQHIGDLENLSAEAFFIKTINHMRRILDIHPAIIAHDLHPGYLSTAWALAQTDKQRVGIQHHHAHIVSCMAENRVHEPVIGLAFDGTGYGPDQTVWGGEILLAELDQYTRLAHLSPCPMPGSTAAIKEPWRMAVSYLQDCYGDAFAAPGLPLLQAVNPEKIRIISRMANEQVNAPLTSSLGRLFDGVAAIIGLRYQVSFEGQAAMEMEMAADETVRDRYPHGWSDENPCRIELRPIIQGVVRDVLQQIPVPVVCGRFHNTLIHLFTELTVQMGKETGLKQVALSGGVFQNRILTNGLVRELNKQGVQVLTHSQVPCNDGGISLGQALSAAIRTGEQSNVK